MAVAKMKLVSVIGQVSSLDQVVSACGNSNDFQPDDAMSFFSDTSGFVSVKEENPYIEPLNKLDAAVKRLEGSWQMNLLMDGRPDEELFQYVKNFSQKVDDLIRKRSELSAQLESVNKNVEQYLHFKGLNIDLNSMINCETIKVRFGRLPKESYVKLQDYNENPYVLFFPGASDAEYYWGVYFTPIDYAQDVDRIFSSLYFERMRLSTASGTPEEIIAHLEQEKVDVAKQIEDLDAELKQLWKAERSDCSKVHARLAQLNCYFNVRQYAARYNDKFILAGWIPAYAEKKIRQTLDEIDAVEYTIEKPDRDTHHTPPVKLQNCSLFRPFEFFVDMYGLPRYSEIDPTAFVAISFTLLFGIMFGDVGQGILVSVIGYLMWRMKKMAIGRILVPCGISSAVFGLVYGSVFGFEHVLDPLYHALFGLQEKPVEVMKSSTATMIILASVVIGLCLIVLSMILNIYSSLRRKNLESGLFGQSGIAGLVFFVSTIAGCVAQFYFKVPVMNTAYILCLIVLPLVLIFFREPLGRLVARDPNWKPESWGDYIVQNIFELFEVLLTYVSNTMSFLRVGAFVLVHAGMMMAVFAIANIFGPFGFTVAVVIGNALVMVMEALLVAIQVMRLEFYEMFSRYYIGDGRAFEPLNVEKEVKSA